MMYKTFLINHGYYVYEGSNQDMAYIAAAESGFESAVFEFDENGDRGTVIATYSPISGWKSLEF